MAVGIGPGVDQETLQLMANGGPVVQVEDFSKLEKMMETIKSSACSGMSKIEQMLRRNPPAVRVTRGQIFCTEIIPQTSSMRLV